MKIVGGTIMVLAGLYAAIIELGTLAWIMADYGFGWMLAAIIVTPSLAVLPFIFAPVASIVAVAGYSVGALIHNAGDR